MSAVIQRRLLSPGANDAAEASLAFGAGLSPLLVRVLRNRGLATATDIDLSLNGLLSPNSFKGMEAAVEQFYTALCSQSRILIVGDFDADGATGSALAVRVLQAFGHKNVQFLVPNRFEYGYGLTPEIVDCALHHKPELIVTVDNGISSIAGVAKAREYGIKVVITDHHLPGSELPAADAIVNPNQPGCDFPSKALAGVGVIFYVMVALRKRLLDEGWFQTHPDPPKMSEFLDLVALGTVADVVPLDKNNRILVEQGLRRIRVGRCCVGIRALIETANRSAATLTAADCGFVLGPRLNAAGRLDDISIGIACLLTDDISFAREVARELDTLNRDRRSIEHVMKKEADVQIDKIQHRLSAHSEHEGSSLPTGLCLFDANWHQGVVGIIASRIKEQWHRPVICFAPADDSDATGLLKGSARSIQGFHVRDALDSVASRHPQLLLKFGGHAMAAGLTIEREKFDQFASAFDHCAKELLTSSDLAAIFYSDGELLNGEFSIDNAQLLKFAMPWGQKMPEPMFDGEFSILNQKIVGANHLKLLLTCDGETAIDAIAFNVNLNDWPDKSAERVNMAYALDVNEYRGSRSLQLIAKHIEKIKPQLS